LFATPAQSLEISIRFKGEKSRGLSRQEKAKATERTCQLFCRAETLPLIGFSSRLTACWEADSLSPLPRRYRSKEFNSFCKVVVLKLLPVFHIISNYRKIDLTPNHDLKSSTNSSFFFFNQSDHGLVFNSISLFTSK
jgi:hypothetical protein